ncbi:MAG: tyrosine--tRNA ligase [Candidatus Anstonellales archaeon]
MDVDEKIELIKKRPTEEIVSEHRLRELIETKSNIKHYIGFEISGFAHIGTGLATAVKIKDLMQAGIKPCIFLADYHSWINKKLGGDLDLIRKIAKGYFKHVFISLGLDEESVSYILASDIYDNDYWKTCLEIANNATLSRVSRATTIMGRKESDVMPSSFVIYPIMQAADIFKLDIDIAHAGMDQRKAHMLALDVASKINKRPFIALHTHLIPSLQGFDRMNPEDTKMSKSKPETALFVHESPEVIRQKISKAYCPEKNTEENPVWQILEWIILRSDEQEFTIKREQKYGGDVTGNIKELRSLYEKGSIHPNDLKSNVADWLIENLEPVRKYFEKHEHYLKEMEQARITR